MEFKGYIHAKRKHRGNNSGFQTNNSETKCPMPDEVVFKWISVKGERLSVEANRAVYEEYKEVRSQLLKDTVYNSDGSENKEGISRLRQAGLNDKAIYDVVAKGRTPNGYNYHHMFPRAISGTFKDGVEFNGETLNSIHDWRCLLPLPNATRHDIHGNVHHAMEERNGPLPETPGRKMTYDIAVPLSAEEYEKYKQNPKSVKAELLIVTANSYRTIDQRGNDSKSLSIANIAKMKMAKGR